MSSFPDTTADPGAPIEPPRWAGDGSLAIANPDLAWAAEQLGVAPRLPAYVPRDVLPAILGQADLPVDEGAGAMDDIVRRILVAPDMATALSAQTAEGLDAILRLPVYISEPRFYPSDYTGEGSRTFAVVQAVEQDTGIVHTVTIGAVQPLVAIWRAWVTGELPLLCRIVKGDKPTRSGFFPYTLTGV